MKSNLKNSILSFLLTCSVIIPNIFAAGPIVTIETNKGNIVLELDELGTPETTANFIKYVENGYYKDTLFHRVIDGFMIQGGGLNSDMSDKPPIAEPIKNEADKAAKNTIGTIAMARTNEPNSATSQFFINVNDNDFLDFKSKTKQGWGYCVFGKVINGMDVVNAIKAVETTTKNNHQNVPVNNIIINKVSIA